MTVRVRVLFSLPSLSSSPLPRKSACEHARMLPGFQQAGFQLLLIHFIKTHHNINHEKKTFDTEHYVHHHGRAQCKQLPQSHRIHPKRRSNIRCIILLQLSGQCGTVQQIPNDRNTRRPLICYMGHYIPFPGIFCCIANAVEL